MIASADKYIMNYIDFGVNAKIEINKLAWFEDATMKKYKELFKLIVNWQHFGLLDEIADDIKTVLNDITYYFGLYGKEKARLYKRLYKVLKYLESTYLIDIEDFKPILEYI